ncbi:MAG: hypothetical protein HXX11_13925 [Desulfuromonadales bacterium]|nr:hypothetical protein [Desulfuromonadales bacterium]
MILRENELLAAMKELLEASQAMTNGKLPSATAFERYLKAVKRSKQIIDDAEVSDDKN